jgi:hypothetical protein
MISVWHRTQAGTAGEQFLYHSDVAESGKGKGSLLEPWCDVRFHCYNDENKRAYHGKGRPEMKWKLEEEDTRHSAAR